MGKSNELDTLKKLKDLEEGREMEKQNELSILKRLEELEKKSQQPKDRKTDRAR